MKSLLGIGVFIGIYDQQGTPIHIGDTLAFDPQEWGAPIEFTVTLEHGQICHPGATEDLTQWCTVIHSVTQAEGVLGDDEETCS